MNETATKNCSLLGRSAVHRVGQAGVNEALTKKELQAIRDSVIRNRPYGSEEWTEETCEQTGLWSKTRPRGRPRMKPQVEPVQTRPK